MVQQQSTKPIRILLADDDEDDRFLTREAFQHHFPATSMQFVEDGEELIEYLRRTGRYENADHGLPELILLDLNMPRKDGREALQEIKKDPSLRHVPIIVLSTSDAQDDIENSYFWGANSFITKPTSYQKLIDVTKAIGNYWFNVVKISMRLD
ncbi:response regulator [Tellurirhabdus bombi]|uniref:response regulator n=1 Tax=Tellurirhabdus bombi TaxID=2907205 RepID=UPI001F29B8ED|nr:response regulator [Tellurirhabdus bombi]